MKKHFIIASCLFLVLVIAGCSLFGKKPEKTAPELAAEGGKYYADENYQKAIEVYKRLKDWYPYSPYAKEAEIRIADAHFNLEEYDDALFAYEQYEQLHPSDPKIPYIIYQIGRSHYDRIEGIDRTQVPARKAMEAFQRLRSRFPESEYAEKAAPLIEEARNNLAGHEFYVGRFYFKAGHYKAAVKRFETVLNKYSDDTDYHEDAQYYLAEARKHLAQQDAPLETPEPPGSPDTSVTLDRDTGM